MTAEALSSLVTGAEAGGFEPPDPYGSPAFKLAANHRCPTSCAGRSFIAVQESAAARNRVAVSAAVSDLAATSAALHLRARAARSPRGSSLACPQR